MQKFSVLVENFLDRLAMEQVVMHSFLVSVDGKLVCEKYYEPFNRDSLQRMFSATKSFVSVGIGLLNAEGKIDLDESITAYFPEYVDDSTNELIRKTTIRDMLRMATCHEKTTYKVNLASNWVESFFKVEPTHEPGTVFAYDTSATHTLCALVEKLSGKSLIEYLWEKALKEMNFSDKTYCIKDPFGTSMGGSGIMARSIDLLTFIETIANGGCYNGKQLLPKEYVEAATKKQIATYGKMDCSDLMQGYGYQFWTFRNGAFGLYGMGGQFAVYIPDKRLAFVTTADSQEIKGGDQTILNAFWSEIYSHLDEVDDYDTSDLKERVLACMPCEYSYEDSVFNTINAKQITFGKNKGGFENASFEFDGKCGTFTYTNKTGHHSFKFGVGYNEFQKFPHYDVDCAISAGFVAKDTLWIRAQMIGEIKGNVWVEATVKGNTCTLQLRKVEEFEFKEFDGAFTGKF